MLSSFFFLKNSIWKQQSSLWTAHRDKYLSIYLSTIIREVEGMVSVIDLGFAILDISASINYNDNPKNPV